MKKNKFKILYLFFVVCLLLNSEVVFTSSLYDIAKELTTETETTKRKPKGSKVENAQFYDKMYEKNRIIITEGDGGNGDGGKTSGNTTKKNNVNKQNINDFRTNESSTGSGQKSNKAARSLRDAIDESRKESIASELATAQNVGEALRRIEESESIYESIRKAIIQESIRANVFGEKIKPQIFEPIVAPEENTTAPTTAREFKVPTPLSNNSNNFQFNNNRTKTNIDIENRNGSLNPQFIDDINKPTAEISTERLTISYDDNLVPTANFMETVLQTKQNNGATIYEARENNEIAESEVYEEYTNDINNTNSNSVTKKNNNNETKNETKEVVSEETEEVTDDNENIEVVEPDDVNGDSGEKFGDTSDIDSVFDNNGKTTHIKIIEIDTNGGLGIKNNIGSRNLNIYIGIFSLILLFILGFIAYFNLSKKMIEYKSYF